jgi:antitoxin component YwqK of YwqJK toxin-antitoxin module
MKNIFTITLIIIFVACCDKKTIQRDVITTYNDQGKALEEYTINKNGEKVGYIKSFYSNGILKSYSEIIDGEKNGISKFFFLMVEFLV